MIPFWIEIVELATAGLLLAAAMPFLKNRFRGTYSLSRGVPSENFGLMPTACRKNTIRTLPKFGKPLVGELL